MSKTKFIKYLREITPPVIYHAVRSVWPRSKTMKPMWSKVGEGPNAGFSFFVDPKHYQEQLEGRNDRPIWDEISRIDLDGSTILDIGAHIGFYALGLSRLAGQNGIVHAFEPNYANFERLKLNIDRNSEVGAQICTHNIAIGNYDGTVDFTTSDDIDNAYSCGGFIRNAKVPLENQIYINKKFRTESVPINRLDSIFNNESSSAIKLIKIDVEGAEQYVLEGALEILRIASPVLLIEIHSVAAMYGVLNVLQKCGYTSRILDEDGPSRCFIISRRVVSSN